MTTHAYWKYFSLDISNGIPALTTAPGVPRRDVAPRDVAPRAFRWHRGKPARISGGGEGQRWFRFERFLESEGCRRFCAERGHQGYARCHSCFRERIVVKQRTVTTLILIVYKCTAHICVVYSVQVHRTRLCRVRREKGVPGWVYRNIF